MLGTTNIAEVAVAERRLKKAKKEYEAACNVKVSGDTDDLFEGVHAPSEAKPTGESNCREDGKKRDYEISSGLTNDIASKYKSELEESGWFTTNIDGSSKIEEFRATKDGRHLKFQFGGPPDGTKNIHICVWPVWPNDDRCSENCDK
jgi:hypothetical protein